MKESRVGWIVDARRILSCKYGRKIKEKLRRISLSHVSSSREILLIFRAPFSGCVRLDWISPLERGCKIGRGEGEQKSEKEGNVNGRFSFFFFFLAKLFFAARLIRGVKNGTVFLREVALKPWAGKNGERKAGLTLVPRPSRPWWYSACLERSFHGKFGRWLWRNSVPPPPYPYSSIFLRQFKATKIKWM